MSAIDLFEDMKKYVDPLTYDGGDGASCLIGQIGEKSPTVIKVMQEEGLDENYYYDFTEVSEVIAGAYGVEEVMVKEIYFRSAEMPYYCDLDAALKMAATLLNVEATL